MAATDGYPCGSSRSVEASLRTQHAFTTFRRRVFAHFLLHRSFVFCGGGKNADVRTISPLEEGDEVKVVAMAPSEDCEHEMFVAIKWKKRKLAVPLSQLEAMDDDEETREAVEDGVIGRTGATILATPLMAHAGQTF